MDFFHHTLVQNGGVPRGWPGFCLAFDLTAALFVGGVLAFRANVNAQRSALTRVGGMPGRWRHINVQEPQ